MPSRASLRLGWYRPSVSVSRDVGSRALAVNAANYLQFSSVQFSSVPHRAFVCKAERWASYSCCMASVTLELSRT